MGRSYYKGEEPVPGYKLIQPLGRGGFGEVWKANGPGGIPVALKIIGLTGKQGSKELRAIQRVKLIRHPNLVPITAFWLKDRAGNVLDESITESAEAAAANVSRDARAGQGSTIIPTEPATVRAAELIMAMGLGDKSLFDRLEECTRAGMPGIPPDELLSYLEDAARAIDHLNSPRHDLGSGLVSIQHCDIKPQNIMIVGGAAQVCDFGLARVLGDVRSTSAAMSPAYAAPECLKDNKPSEFTDQYSLAISYYELRTGVLPFDHDSYMGVVNAHLQGTLDLSKLPEAERAVIRRAAAVDPKDRYPTTLAMVRALRQAYEGTAAGGPVHKPTSHGVVEPGCELVPGYKLQRLIVRSGHDEVWESSAPGGKPVALVVRRLTGAVSLEDFVALDLLRGLEHDHLTEPHAFWLLDSRGDVVPDEKRDQPDAPPLSMLVIGGKLARKTLRNRLEECQQAGGTGIPVDELIGYTRQVATAVDYLNARDHQLGGRMFAIYHRDIRPVNIVVQGTSVRLGNFSQARVAEGPSFRVRSDGTGLDPNYAAPETLGDQANRWSDQYTLAIVYCHLRTGRLPFDAGRSRNEIIEAHRRGGLNLSDLSLPERAVIARATSSTPGDRYPNCTQMIAELSEACGIAGRDAAASGTLGQAPALPPVVTVSRTIVPAARTTSPMLSPSASEEAAPWSGTMTPQTMEEHLRRDTRATPITETPVESPAEFEAARRSAAVRRTEPDYADTILVAPRPRSKQRIAIVAAMLVGVAILGFFGTRGLFSSKSGGESENPPPKPHTPPGVTEKTQPPSTPVSPITASTSAVKQEIAGRIKQELFADALSVIKKNAAALGGEAAELQEEVFTAWNGKVQAELDSHAFKKAAVTSAELIQAAPERIGGYLRLADVSMADDSVAPFEPTLRRFWDAPRAAADNEDFIARLSELQIRWIQRRVQQPAKAADLATLAQQIAAAEASAPKTVNGWLLAAKAECLMETNDGKPTPHVLEQAIAAIADPRVSEAGGYGQYVTALVAHAAKKPDVAGAELLNIPSEDLTLGPSQTLRRGRAVRILSDAVNKLRTTTTMPPSELLRLDAAKNPFGTPENAATAFRCLERTAELATEPDNPLPVSLRVNQILAAWYKSPRDRATVLELTEKLLHESTRSELGASAVPILLMNIDALEDHGTKLERYATIVDLASKQKPDDEFPPVDLYDIVIEPALKLGEELAEQGPLGPARAKRLAQVHATKGKLILQHRYAAWQFRDKTQEAIHAFDSAITLDAEHAEYFAGRAMAQSRLARPDLAAVEADARSAIKLDEKQPTGHGMLGYALLLQSRLVPDFRSKTAKLKDAVKEFNDAVELCEQEDDRARELGSHLTNRSIAYLELGNHEPDREKRKTHLEQAKADAEQAAGKSRRYPENAWAALGNAMESMAYLLGEKDKYDPAYQEFDRALKERDDVAKSWLDRGRCRFKQAEAFKNDAMLDEAIADLNKAAGFDPPLAEPFRWLGRAYARRGDFKRSDDSFRSATDLAEVQQNPTAWAVYAAEWANTALAEIRVGVRKTPPDTTQSGRLRALRDWAQSRKQHADYFLVASWIAGQANEADNDPRAALKEYGSALPDDLAQAKPLHVKLLLARSSCRFGSEVLWGEDVKRLDAAEIQTPGLHALRTFQAILDADRATELADDALTKAGALTLSATVRTALAKVRRGRPDELELREQAVHQLEEAIALALSDPNCWRRRELLARCLNAIISDRNLNVSADQRAQYRKDAVDNLNRAIQAPEPTRDDREKLAKLRDEIQSR